MTIQKILSLVAFLCFVASAMGVSSRINLQSAGLALFVLALYFV